MSGTNTYKKHLQYNEKEGNVKNIVLDPHKLFCPYHNFIVPHHLLHPLQFYGPTPSTPPTPKLRVHAKILLTHATHAKI